MEVCNPKGGRTAAPASILAMMMMIMMLLNAYCCGGAVLAKSNTSFRCSDGRLDECLIEENLELELGFLMNLYVSRILTGGHGSGTTPLKPDKPAVTCGKENDPQYSSCISRAPKQNNNSPKKGVYHRP